MGAPKKRELSPSLWAEMKADRMAFKRAYRRCHVCGNVCEDPRNVRRCSDCDKPFAPFYYFNDEFSPILNEGELRPPLLEGQWRPIHGLTAYWQNE